LVSFADCTTLAFATLNYINYIRRKSSRLIPEHTTLKTSADSAQSSRHCLKPIGHVNMGPQNWTQLNWTLN